MGPQDERGDDDEGQARPATRLMLGIAIGSRVRGTRIQIASRYALSERLPVPMPIDPIAGSLGVRCQGTIALTGGRPVARDEKSRPDP
jgi:hypothetical protein